MIGMVPGDTVGVAPDAHWIAAGVTDCPGASYPSMNIAAYQWAMNPDSNIATTSDMPDVINCSWRDPNATGECTGIYVQTLSAVEAVGIAVVFSAGNSGPNASTITAPKNINIDLVM
jgi:subtilisin family serine protease